MQNGKIQLLGRIASLCSDVVKILVILLSCVLIFYMSLYGVACRYTSFLIYKCLYYTN